MRSSFVSLFSWFFVACAADSAHPVALPPVNRLEVPAASAAPTASAAPVASVAPAALGDCPAYEARMTRGRTLASERRYAEASSAFDDAVRARPYDAAARLERGRARLAANRPFLHDFELARSLSRDPELQTQALLGAATVQELARKPEAARLALAIAALSGNAEGARRLAGRSTCTAQWATAQLPELLIVGGWLEALAQRTLVGCESDAAPSSESAARKELCRPCQGGELKQENACAGPGPYTIPTGYMHCGDFSLLVQPLGGGRMYLDASGGQALQTSATGYLLDLGSSQEFEWNTGDFTDGASSEFNGVRWADSTTDLDPPECPIDANAEVGLLLSSGCQAGPGVAVLAAHTRRWFDHRGKARLEVSEYAGPVQVSIAGNRAQLDGAGCHETVALPP